VIPVKIEQMFLSNMGFVVLLKGLKDERSLPIFIGAAEAQSIAMQLNKIQTPRPLTHDLLKNVLDFLECRLMRVDVCDLKEGTFYAKLVLDRDGRRMELDSRPSDAIALALRVAAPIYVAEKVMEEAGRVFDASAVEQAPAPGEPSAPDQAKQPPRALTPLEQLRQDLDQAVKEERYEDACRLRDEIKGLEQRQSEN
jgi:uncharacterized protein